MKHLFIARLWQVFAMFYPMWVGGLPRPEAETAQHPAIHPPNGEGLDG